MLFVANVLILQTVWIYHVFGNFPETTFWISARNRTATWTCHQATHQKSPNFWVLARTTWWAFI